MFQRPDEVVLTRSLANRLFGADYRNRYDELIGQTLTIDRRDLRIGGVLEDVPDHTNVYFQLLLPMEMFRQDNPDWTANWESTPRASNAFFTLTEGATPEQVTDVINQLMPRHLDEDLTQRRTYHVQALSDVHTEARYGGTFFPVPLLLLGALIGLGLVVLLTGSINFVNLSTAQAIQRSKEIGIRKVLGGQKRQLLGQFLGEAGLQVVVASLLAVALADLMLDGINDYLAPYTQWVVMRFELDLSLLLFLAPLALLVTLLAGMYPALVLTRFQPAVVLKQSVATTRTGFGARFSLRKLLTVTQFAIAQVLLIGTLVTATQMRYFEEQDQGFVQDNVLMVDLPVSERNAVAGELFRQQALSHASVEQVALGSAPPTSRNRSWNEGYAAGGEKVNLEEKVIDPHYVETFGLTLVAGRNLRDVDYAPDSVTNRAVLLNERAVHTLGFESPEAALGHTFTLDRGAGIRMEVVGVLADFVNNSLKKEIQPGYFYYGDALRVAHVRISGPPTEVLSTLQAQWEALYPDAFFQYEWVDEHVAMLYTLEDMLYRLFRLMAGLALLVGGLGLYGLASYLMLHRRKEIGIRKTLGATVSDILFRFTREFAGLVLLAFAVATPLGYLAMRAWLGTFAHRIELHAGFFGATLLIALTLAALTVGYRSLLAAGANPVDSLRDE
jgi:ABC-type antimicrobial peptide transport system permease subunit